ncbi:flagellar hook-length control protein FliK [Marinobacter sp. S6332]|uniref:flagellar hook-length control protein FliK n=1 Tax=Marinobacter sp. S6332 TaxID=2926403 RepID=UPI001FF6B185|nr:flagellar hook-length control protein FliK [Marinobacter sp. S6332]MCK0163835.1 flagellar hook-length control protein FliK [Marinobacter sp. S6332]
MTQMVLPQTPAPGIQKDAGAQKASSDRDSGAGESRYESVSRAEQRRLDRQQSGRSDAPDNARNNNAKSSGNGEGAQKVSKTDSKKAVGESKVAEKESLEGGATTLPDMEVSATPLTFAELQALLLPDGGLTGNPAAVAAAAPAPIQGGELFAGLAGAGAQPGQAASGSGGGLVTALQLTEALVPSAGDKASAMDPASLLTGNRFESAVELVAQQNANSATGKLVSEAQVPLRSYATSVDVPVNHAEWGDKLMGKLSWLTAKNLSVAEIHLTPPDMGPMEVRVRVQNDQANITVHSANPVVREQLELHSHRLRDMLGEQGLDLAQFDVSDNSRNQSGQQNSEEGDDSSAGSGSALSSVEGTSEDMQTGSLDLSWNGAVDIFA